MSHVSTHIPKDQELFQKKQPLTYRASSKLYVLHRFQIIKSNRLNPCLKKILTLDNSEILMKHQLSENGKSQDVLSVLIYRKTNSLNSNTAEILTYIARLHVYMQIFNLYINVPDMRSNILVKLGIPSTSKFTNVLSTGNRFVNSVVVYQFY